MRRGSRIQFNSTTKQLQYNMPLQSNDWDTSFIPSECCQQSSFQISSLKRPQTAFWWTLICERVSVNKCQGSSSLCNILPSKVKMAFTLTTFQEVRKAVFHLGWLIPKLLIQFYGTIFVYCLYMYSISCPESNCIELVCTFNKKNTLSVLGDISLILIGFWQGASHLIRPIWYWQTLAVVWDCNIKSSIL